MPAIGKISTCPNSYMRPLRGCIWLRTACGISAQTYLDDCCPKGPDCQSGCVQLPVRNLKPVAKTCNLSVSARHRSGRNVRFDDEWALRAVRSICLVKWKTLNIGELDEGDDKHGQNQPQYYGLFDGRGLYNYR